MKNMTLNPELKLKELFSYGVSAKQYVALFSGDFIVSNGKHGDTYWVHINDDSVSDIVLPRRFFHPKEESLVQEASSDDLDYVDIIINGKSYYAGRTELKEFRRHQKAYVNEVNGDFIDYDDISIKLKKRRQNNATKGS